jgi:hypothetical protein
MATTKTLTAELIAQRFTLDLEAHTHTMIEFSQKIATDPAYAMKWGDNAVEAAGAIEVLNIVINCFNGSKEATPETLLELLITEANDRIMHNAMYPSRSTSPMANLIEVAKTTAWANVRREAMRLAGRY